MCITIIIDAQLEEVAQQRKLFRPRERVHEPYES